MHPVKLLMAALAALTLSATAASACRVARFSDAGWNQFKRGGVLIFVAEVKSVGPANRRRPGFGGTYPEGDVVLAPLRAVTGPTRLPGAETVTYRPEGDGCWWGWTPRVGERVFMTITPGREATPRMVAAIPADRIESPQALAELRR